MNSPIQPRKTRKIRIGSLTIGGDSPIAVQSMTATRTVDIDATARQIQILEKAGADIIRIAVDSKEDVEALKTLRQASKGGIFSGPAGKLPAGAAGGSLCE